MKIELECTYCGFKWIRHMYTMSSDSQSCPKCQDKKIKARRLDNEIDYYEGCPPFEKEVIYDGGD